jgi:hypothetical protein
MYCLNSIITDKFDTDPNDSRLVITWSCPKCDEESESNDVEFYNYSMAQLSQDIFEK